MRQRAVCILRTKHPTTPSKISAHVVLSSGAACLPPHRTRHANTEHTKHQHYYTTATIHPLKIYAIHTCCSFSLAWFSTLNSTISLELSPFAAPSDLACPEKAGLLFICRSAASACPWLANSTKP